MTSKTNQLPSDIQKEVMKFKHADIIVGVLCKNVASTVLHVLNTISEGLHRYFSEYKNLIVVTDGFSIDRTMELATLFQPYNGINKIVTEDIIEGGKGAGVKTILQIANAVDAKIVILLDGDLLSIQPEWIYEFASPIMYGRADLVVPFYVRDKYDGVITNNLIYPFTRAVYGFDVRQPIAGEYGLSKNLYDTLLSHPLFPLDFGIDIFIVTSAMVKNMAIREGLFCLKLHESTTRYLEPDELLIPMFRQVTSTMFDLAHYYEDFWRHNQIHEMPTSREFFCKKPIPVAVDIDKMEEYFKREFATVEKIIGDIVPQEILRQIKTIVEGESMFSNRLWSHIVYMFAAHYKTLIKEDKYEILDALKALWLGRFVSYAKETVDMSLNNAEMVIQEQAHVFEKELDFFRLIY